MIFEDDCRRPTRPANMATMQLEEGQCSSSIGRSVFPTFHGTVTLRPRFKNCHEEVAMNPNNTSTICSDLKTVALNFHGDDLCDGMMVSQEIYPMDRKCLRYINGTQLFYIDPTNSELLVQLDYPLSADCTENRIGCEDCVTPHRFYIELKHCYTVSTNGMGFQWVPTFDMDEIEEGTDDAENGDSSNSTSTSLAVWSILVVLFLQ